MQAADVGKVKRGIEQFVTQAEKKRELLQIPDIYLVSATRNSD